MNRIRGQAIEIFFLLTDESRRCREIELERRFSKKRGCSRRNRGRAARDYFQTFIRTELSAYIRNVQGLSPFSKKIMKFVLKSMLQHGRFERERLERQRGRSPLYKYEYYTPRHTLKMMSFNYRMGD